MSLVVFPRVSLGLRHEVTLYIGCLWLVGCLDMYVSTVCAERVGVSLGVFLRVPGSGWYERSERTAR